MNGTLSKLFRAAPPPLIGVDIGSSSVKLAQLSKAGSAYRLEAFAVEPLPSGAVNEGAIAEPEQVAEAVKRAIKRGGFKAKACAMAVAGSAVITKVINLPSDLSEEDIEGQIEVEAGQYIPYPREEVSLDFEVLGPSPRNADLLEILLAASKSEHVDSRRIVADLAGLTVRVVDVESYAIANAFKPVLASAGIAPSETVAALNIGATASSMIVMRGDRVIYNREHSFGSALLIEECMRRYGMDADQAQFLQRGDEPPAGFDEEVLEPFRQNIVQQISRALQFYGSSSDYSSLSTVFVCGGGASLPGLPEAIGSEVGISCELTDPLKDMRLSPKINVRALDKSRPALVTACGLAMRGFD